MVLRKELSVKVHRYVRRKDVTLVCKVNIVPMHEECFGFGFACVFRFVFRIQISVLHVCLLLRLHVHLSLHLHTYHFVGSSASWYL